MKPFLVIYFFTFTLINAIYGQNNDSIKQHFINLETKLMNTWKNKDEATARKLISDDFTLTSSLSTGELANKEEWIDKMHHFDCKDFQINNLQVRIYDKTAVVNVWLHQNAVANGKDWSGDFLLTDIWIQKNNGWEIVARHSSWLQKK
jgi:hypothetical protein